MSLLQNLTSDTSSGNAPDLRLEQLTAWLATLNVVDVASARPASADASFRRYFRVDVLPDQQAALGATLVVMDAPPERENVLAFVKLDEMLTHAGVSVPRIVATDYERGFLLMSDLGVTTYLQVLDHDNASTMYAEALEALVKFQLTSQPGVLPEYDRAFMLREMNLFPEWYIGQHLKATLTDKQAAELQAVFDAILANVTAQQQVYVHRDFHSRNLMWMDAGNPGVLDFQDALYGPMTYDLASLLRDAYVQWDEELVLDWAIRYWQHAKSLGLPVSQDIDAFYQDFEYAGLQRHLKILGLFCRLNYRDGKAQYLNDLPTVMDYVRKTASRYKDLRPLVRLLDQLEDKQPQVGYTF
ncbi:MULTISPECIES: aminoglycoside phosphotransferase family protein [unclassified Duganella]|uniref:aminoglycoside phosphotransferase family protein n=1 Tax=unclassified Duganella TaxID=2636909 RepID=UPI000E351D1B|nr:MULTISPECIES: phosphotransferase [unclassified Duganella]RFP11264.1 aminoglycoside phosphotransferase [Duganella sp. BJB475]RFP29583.1 aminoglycoside phosphotransferase [Duganella sp. BJB476]